MMFDKIFQHSRDRTGLVADYYPGEALANQRTSESSTPAWQDRVA